MTVSVSPVDLGTYMGVEVDEGRAALLLRMTTTLANAVVTPLPDGAEAVILSATARAYANPLAVTSETVGPMSVTRPAPGAYLTRAERRTIRNLAGQGGGAFTIDPTPTTVMRHFRDPLAQPTDQEAVEYLEEQGY